jgi:hypothetical protein
MITGQGWPGVARGGRAHRHCNALTRGSVFGGSKDDLGEKPLNALTCRVVRTASGPPATPGHPWPPLAETVADAKNNGEE